MANKIYMLTKNINKPIVKSLVKNGWYYRLQRLKNNGGKFKKLTNT